MTAGESELLWPAIDIAQAAERLRLREVSARELVDAHLAELEKLEGHIHACLTVTDAGARDAALAADAVREQLGDAYQPLLGIPVAIKDNFETAGVRTTAGSALLKEYVPTRDATLVERLRRAGAVFVAKTNLDEFAYGGEAANELAVTVNPWDLESVPGGSSGGSGAAVAARMCMAATGSDTGGSIRNPSGWCGVVGFKPTFGAIDPGGLVPLAWSLDTAGFLARTVADCAVLFYETANASVAGAPSERERLTASARPDFAIKPRIAVATNVFDLCEASIRQQLLDATSALAREANIGIVELPRLNDAVLATMTIITSEGAAAWEPSLRDSWHDFGARVRGALDVGRLIRATEYIHAQRVREGLRLEVAELMSDYDALVLPAMGIDPRPGVFEGSILGRDSPMWELEAKFTCLWNLTGAPVVSVPCTFTESGRPLTMQIVAKPGDDATALRVAALAEATWSLPREALVPFSVRTHQGALATSAEIA